MSAFSRIVAIAFLLATASIEAAERSLILATTTSVDNSGLLRAITAAFRADTGITIHPVIVGSGKALRIFTDGDADVAITHDAEAEARVVRSGATRFYQPFMRNEFVVVGPRDDSAGVRGAKSAAEAFRRIHAARARFCARNDGSGTSTREQAIWRSLKIDPRQNPRYLPLGQSMAALLRSCTELRGYALTDSATFAQIAHELDVVMLYRGDPALRNPYAVLLPRARSKAAADAERFVKWLLSPAGRRVIDGYRIRGRQYFFTLTP